MRGALTHFQQSGGDYLTRKKLRAAHAKLIKSVITVVYLFSPTLRQARGAGEMAPHLKVYTALTEDLSLIPSMAGGSQLPVTPTSGHLTVSSGL